VTAVSGIVVDSAPVDFDLSADQADLKAAAGKLLERYASHDQLRARVGPGVVVGTLATSGTAHGESPAAHDAPSGFDRDLWQAMADQGWLAVELAESEGGLGLSMVEVCVLAEQLGRVLAPAPYLSSVLALGALPAGISARTDAWREALASGSAVGCVLWEGSTPLGIDTNHGATTLSGRLGPALYAPSADVGVVVTKDAVFALDLGETKRGAPEPAMDRTRELGFVELEGTRAEALGGADEAVRLFNRAATAVSAELLGAADRALELAVVYAKDRVQFGKPIGSFQAIKHKLADALVDVEGMRSLAYYAGWCTANEHPEAALAASMAKAWCSDASRRVMATALQVHGGIGFTWEHDLHLYLKRAQLDQVSAGDASTHRDRVAKILRQRLSEDTQGAPLR
jgi:acyl-CoA dehydrogenase